MGSWDCSKGLCRHPFPSCVTVIYVAARKAVRSVKFTDEALAELQRFTRELAVRVNANVTYSAAILYAIAATESTHQWLEGRES